MPTTVVRDSAGIQIVESSALAWDEGEEWRLSEAPELDIGVVEGDPNYQMFRVSGATRLSDGRVGVTNTGSSEIRFYDVDGRFLKAVGRPGEGPGEFRALFGIWPFRGDSLVAWDEKLRRITVLTLDGEFARNALVEKSGWNPRTFGPFADGSLFSVDEPLMISGTSVQQQHTNLLRHSPEGALLDSLGSFPNWQSLQVRFSGGGSLIANVGFGPRTAITASPSHFFVGLARAYEVGAYTPEGRLARLIRWQGEERAVNPQDIERYKEQEVAEVSSEEQRRSRREYLSQIPFSDQFPAYSELIADRGGNLWVRAYDRPGYEGPRRWLVVDRDGRALGVVHTPKRMWIFEIGDDYVLGVERDEMDVEHVRMYRLLKD